MEREYRFRSKDARVQARKSASINMTTHKSQLSYSPSSEFGQLEQHIDQRLDGFRAWLEARLDKLECHQEPSLQGLQRSLDKCFDYLQQLLQVSSVRVQQETDVPGYNQNSTFWPRTHFTVPQNVFGP